MTIANQIISFKLSGINFTGSSTQLNYTSGVLPGVSQPSKALVLDESSRITGIQSLSTQNLVASSLTGLIATPAQPNITSVGNLSGLTVGGVLNVSQHNGIDRGLQLGGTLVLSNAVELNYVRVTPGTAAASRALVMDSNTNIQGINQLSASTINVSTLRIAGATLTATAAQLNALDLSTPGVVQANRVVSLDSDKSVTGITTIGVNAVVASLLTGTLQTAAQPNITSVGTLAGLVMTGNLSGVSNISLSGNITGANVITANTLAGVLTTAAQPNVTSVGTLSSLSVSGNTSINTLSVAGITLAGQVISATSAELNSLAGTTPGTAQPSKAIVVSASRAVSNLGAVSADSLTASSLSGVLLTAAQPNVTSLGILTGLNMSGPSSTSITNSAATPVAVDIWNNQSNSLSARVDLSNLAARIGTSSNHPFRLFAANTTVMSIETNGGVNIGDIGQTSFRLNVSGSLNAGQLFVAGVGITATPAEINALAGLTIGSVSANRVVVADSSRSLSNLGTITATTITATSLSGLITTASQPTITSLGTLNGLTVASPSTTQANVLLTSASTTDRANLQLANNSRSVEIGLGGGSSQIAPNMLYVMDVGGSVRLNMNASGNISLDGNSTTHRLNVPGSLNVNQLFLSSARVDATADEVNVLAAATPGTATPGKAVVVDSSRSMANLNSLTAVSITGTIATPSQPNITSLGTLSGLNMLGGINGVTNINMTGNITGASNLSANTITGALTTTNQPNITSLGTLTGAVLSGRLKIGTPASSAEDFIHIEGNSSTPFGMQLENRSTVSDSGTYIKFTGYSDGNSNYDLASISCGYVAASSLFGFGYLAFSTRNNQSAGSASEKMRIMPSGNVGINTQSPEYTLDVGGQVNTTQLVIGGTAVTATAVDLNRIAGVTSGVSFAGKALVVDASRNVSNIGTLTASTLAGTLSTPAQPGITSVGTLTSLNMAGTISGATSITASGLISASTLAASSVLASTVSGTLQTAEQPNVTRLGILSNLSIGTSLKLGTPTNLAQDVLHLEYAVSGRWGIQMENISTTADSGTYLRFSGFNNSNQNYELASIFCGYVVANASYGFGYLAFSTRNSPSTTNATERMRLTQDGRLGIGTVSPVFPLEVNGNIKGTRLTLGNSYDSTRAISALFTMGSGTEISTSLGFLNSTNNCGEQSFYFESVSSNSNAIRLGTFNSLYRLSVDGNGYVGIGLGPVGYNASNNLHINQRGTSTCVSLDFDTISSVAQVKLGVTSNGKLFVNSGMCVGSTASTGFGYVYIAGMDSVVYNNYGFVRDDAVIGTNVNSNSVGVSLRTAGRIVAFSEIGIISDARTKQNIAPLSQARVCDILDKLTPKTFQYKKEPSKTVMGFIAQDLLKTNEPELQNLVSINGDPAMTETIDSDAFKSPQGAVFSVNMEGVVPLLVGVVKEQKSKIQSLERTVALLQEKIEEIAKAISAQSL